MAKWTYDESLTRLLVSEGGYSNHPADPGGPTNYGITLADYRKYVKSTATANDVMRMNIADARRIYRARYWDAQRCDDLPAGLDYSVFDYGVNSGIGRSGRVLRALAGLAANTSVVDAAVLDAVARRHADDLVRGMNDERLAFLKKLKTWPTFGAGWGKRVAAVRVVSLRMCETMPIGKPVPIGLPDPGIGGGKAVVPLPTSARNTTAGTGTIATTATVQQLWLAGHRPIVIGAAIGGGLIVVIGGAYAFHYWQQKKQHDVRGIAAVPVAA